MNPQIDTIDKQTNMNRTQITNTNTDDMFITTTTMTTMITTITTITTTNVKSTNTSTMSIGNNLYERRRNWRIHQMKSCIQPTNHPTTSIYNSKGDDGLCMNSRKTDILHSKENWWRKTISHEPSILITPFAQILTILNRTRDFLSNYTSKIHSQPSNDPDMKSVGCGEKYIDYAHQFDGYYVDELLNEFDWCLEVLDSLQSKRSVSSLTRKKLRNLLSQELAASINQSDDEINKENSTQISNDSYNNTITSSNVHFDDTSLKKRSSYQHDHDCKKSQINLIQKRKQQFTSAKSQVCEYICKTFLEEEEEDDDDDDDDDDDKIVDAKNNYRDEVGGETNSVNIGESHNLSIDKSIHTNSSKLKLRFNDINDEMIVMNESNMIDSKSISSTQNDHLDVITTTMKLITMNIEHVDDSGVENFIINNQSNFAPDLFKLDQISNHHPLSTFGFYLFMKTNTLQKLSIPPVTMLNCLRQIEYRYNSTAPFHNSIHALDVLHATYQLFQCNNLKNIFSDLEMFSIFFASAIHDIDHPGLTNQYLINTNHELALLYNDISVLENHHLHVAFKLINTEKQCDFTQYLTSQQKQLFRKMVITLVLSTDMSKHMSLLADLKTTVEKQKAFQGNVISLDSYSARMQILECVIHAADLSNPTKPLKIYQEWVSRIMEEMFRQGDQERQFGIEISPMCDRETACVYSTQIGFIDYIVYPLWETMAELLYPGAQILMENIANNRNWYVNAKESHRKSNSDQ
ncbi:hypothetical protein MN116_008344 [Schistosoma mekongi]|uniref:Phosphodiesterase n=1 Tax=Schistosoma mekongi TaxID=38744 RepID=A0AAE1Z6H1_SCHME|nr:hypothetical protein MN116_008344 [Schistosoma mekongi]